MKIKIAIVVYLIITSHFVFAQKTDTNKKIEQEVKQAMEELNNATTTGDMEKTKSLTVFTLYATSLMLLRVIICLLSGSLTETWNSPLLVSSRSMFSL